MSKAEKIATSAALNYSAISGNKQAALDPATILSFLQMIMQVVDMFKSCKQPAATAVSTVKNPGLFARLRLRGLVRDSMSRADFRDHGEHIISALLKTGHNLTLEDVNELYKA